MKLETIAPKRTHESKLGAPDAQRTNPKLQRSAVAAAANRPVEFALMASHKHP
jgi:hypothetical protein